MQILELQKRAAISGAFLLLPFQDVIAQTNTKTSVDPFSTGSLTNLFLGLILVLVVFFCIAYVLNRLSGTSTNSRGYINVIDTMHLGTREKIVLLKVGDSCIVLGVSPGGVKTLHVLDGDLPEIDSNKVDDFRSKLSGFLSTGLKTG